MPPPPSPRNEGTDMSPLGDAGVVQNAALLLVKCSDQAWLRLLDEHRPVASGHCGACFSTTLGSPMWPCAMWSIARRAQLLVGERARAAEERA